MTTIEGRTAHHIDQDVSLLIAEDAPLYDAMDRLGKFRSASTLFATNTDNAVTGSLSRGDIIRCLGKLKPPSDLALKQLRVRSAMQAIGTKPRDAGMLYVEAEADASWYEQITDLKKERRELWHRIRLLPVLDKKRQIVSIIDLETHGTRNRLEALVMAVTFERSSRNIPGSITDHAIFERRTSFNSIHYATQLKKVRALCALVNDKQSRALKVDAVLKAGRADELANALVQSREWLSGHWGGKQWSAEKSKLFDEIKTALDRIMSWYRPTGSRAVFPSDADPKLCNRPQVIVTLGCKDAIPLTDRVAKTFELLQGLECAESTLLLSGGGFAGDVTEARHMCDLLEKEFVRAGIRHTLSGPGGKTGWRQLKFEDKTLRIALEEDSLDTLGNAVFSWLRLKMDRRYGLCLSDPEDICLERLAIVTSMDHAPRAYDIFGRVFAFQGNKRKRPDLVVACAGDPKDKKDEDILKDLQSESQTNSQIYRMINPLRNEFDIIENGHMRSILLQMLQHHALYRNRWDLVRKYQGCFNE